MADGRATRDHLVAGFQAWLKERGLKATSQRDDIARVFFGTDRHVSVEELYGSVKKVNERVGYATVYRTLRLLKQSGLAVESHFNDGEARYERIEGEAAHHDHLICESCGRIEEFENPKIEQLQERVADARGFVITRHRLELYGLCSACQTGKRSAHA